MPDPFAAEEAARAYPDLAAWRAEGWQRLELGDPHGAAEAFGRVISPALASPEWADSIALREHVRRGAGGLAECLPALEKEPAARLRILHSLFGIFEADLPQAPDGLTREMPFLMLRHARPEERMQAAAWVRRALAGVRDAELAEEYWRLLLELEALDPPSLEALLAQGVEVGQAIVVAEKLLDLDRVGQALILVRQKLQDTAEFLRFAGSPAARGQARAVMAQAEDRLAAHFDPALADWLATRYAERGDLPRALQVRLKLLQMAPGRGDYEAVRALAQRLGRWEKLAPELTRALQRNGSEEAAVELALGGEDLARAWPCVARAPERYSPAVVARLAAWAGESQPAEAITLYRHLVERALAGQGRAAMREAIPHLLSLRSLYRRQGLPGEWQAYLDGLVHTASERQREELRRAPLW